MKIGILADDFTGANDVALQLIKYGLKVETLINFEKAGNSDYFVYSTETRNANEIEAKNIIDRTFENIKNYKFDKIYKKIDSTLRGNVKIEAEEMLKYLEKDEKIAVIVPYPKTGRVVKNGRHYVNGVSLLETEFAKDPICPVKSDNVLDYFHGKLISLGEIRGGNLEYILKNIDEQVLIFEGEVEEDLIIIAKALVKTNLDKKIVGSAGIMEYLLKEWGYEKEKILFVAGSCNPSNISQIEKFIMEYNPTVYDYFVDKDSLVCENHEELYVLRSIRSTEEIESSLKKMSTVEIRKNIAKYAKTICNEKGIKKIVLSGGDITISFMEEMKISKIEVLAQIEPGIAFGKSEEFQLITKPGGFGTKDIYKNIYSFLQNYR